MRRARRRQDWPSKPIRLVVPFAPGGAADVWGRILAEQLSTALKQSVVVENRGGAGGMLAATQVARAEPDGYTILIGGLAPQIIAPAVANSPGFDALRDFTPIAYIGGPPLTWVVPPSSELRSVDDVIAAAKADKFSGYASSGVGTLGHLVVEYVAKRHGLKLTHIPYNTAAFADIIAGRVPMGSFTWGAALGQVQGGTLRALAVTTEARRPDVPGVPTFKELGYDLVASTWFSLAGPKGLPNDDRAATQPGDAPHLRSPGDTSTAGTRRVRTKTVDAGAVVVVHAVRNRALGPHRARRRHETIDRTSMAPPRKSRAANGANIRLAADIGGTFTDIAMFDDTERPADLRQGAVDARAAGRRHQRRRREGRQRVRRRRPVPAWLDHRHQHHPGAHRRARPR